MNARDQSCAPNRNDDRVHIGHCRKYLDSHRPLPCNDGRIIEPVDVGEARALINVSACCRASSMFAPASKTFAPSLRQLLIFVSGALFGITTVAGNSKAAAHGKPIPTP